MFSPHLLAPTASDLRKWGKLNTILAGFHTDLNFLCENIPSYRLLQRLNTSGQTSGQFMVVQGIQVFTSGLVTLARELLSKYPLGVIS